MVKQRRACDACYKRKIQCDLSGPGPRCNWCSHRDSPCTFDRVRGRKKGSGRDAFRKDMAQRIERIEEAIAKANALRKKEYSGSTSSTTPISVSPQQAPSPPQAVGEERYTPVPILRHRQYPTPPPSSTSTVTTLGKVYFGGSYLGFINSHNSMPSLSEEGQRWIFSATGEWPTLPNFHEVDSLARRRPAVTYLKNADPAELPKIWVVRSLLDQYLQSDLSHVFPVIDPVLFQDTIAQAYGPLCEERALEIVSAKASVLAFLAFTGLHFTETVAGSYMDTDACAAQSQVLASSILEDSGLTALQATVFLILYHTSSGRLQASSMCQGIAIRTVFSLGGHTIVPPSTSRKDPTIQDRRDIQLRNMFWLIYIIDKEIALRTGQPPIIHDEYCNLTLPHEYLEQQSAAMGADTHCHQSPMSLLPGDLRLSILKSKTCRVLYSVEASRKSDVELLRCIRELDEELENWRSSIPAEFAPALSTKYRHSNWCPDNDQCMGRNVRRIMLNLEYHHLMTIIHSASGRCMKPMGGPDETRVLQSSLELSVEASRATLDHLSEATHNFPAEAFWFLIFYPMSAVVTLFFNILRDPLSLEARKDVELLSSVGALTKAVSARQRLAFNDIVRVENLDQFIKELCRLGELAIARAQGVETPIDGI